MLFFQILKILDFYGKVPDELREDDPNFASVFLTNLGSIRCPSVYHHLNNYGTNSIMIAIGTLRKEEKIAPGRVPAVCGIWWTSVSRWTNGWRMVFILDVL